MNELNNVDTDEGAQESEQLIELGNVTTVTQGTVNGALTEISILPRRYLS